MGAIPLKLALETSDLRDVVAKEPFFAESGRSMVVTTEKKLVLEV